MWGKTLTSADQLKPALEAAFQQEGPSLIAIPIDYSENRKLTKRLGELAFTIRAGRGRGGARHPARGSYQASV